MTQDEVRAKYHKRLEREKQDYIAEVTGIHTSALSRFRNRRGDLYEESLQKLNDYLDGKLETNQ